MSQGLFSSLPKILGLSGWDGLFVDRRQQWKGQQLLETFVALLSHLDIPTNLNRENTGHCRIWPMLRSD